MARAKFIGEISEHNRDFGVIITEATIDRLADYFELVQEHNRLLHLVGPCSPEEFATRHILESLTLLEHLPQTATFADVGAGAGVPSIPCLIVREDLKAILIESKEKKAGFLEQAVTELGISNRSTIVNRQFEETHPGGADFVTCRALDKFTEKLPKLLRWSKGRRLLFFGGKNLVERLQANGVRFVQKLMPMSEQRYLFISDGKQGTDTTSERF